MKHLLLIFVVMGLFACSSEDTEDPTQDPNSTDNIIIPPGTPSPIFDENGGCLEYRFTAKSAWNTDVTATRAATWCSVSPTSGDKGEVTLSIATQPNDTPDERNASISIRAGKTTKTFSVTQKQKDALTVTSSKIEVGAEGDDILIEVKANISFTHAIGADCADWITSADTRAMTTSQLQFKVSPNNDSAVREGSITIRSSEGEEVVKIYQGGSVPAIVLTQRDYTVSAAGETIKVEVKSNVEYEVTMPEVEWIKESTTRMWSTHTRYYTISPNESYDLRTAEIVFTNKTNNLTQKVTVSQVQKDAIVVAKSEYEFGMNGGLLNFDVQANVELMVTISASGQSWIRQEQTRGLEQKSLHFDIAASTQNDNRTGTITIKGGSQTQTVTVKQSGMKEVPAKERAALVEFYIKTGGDNWVRSNNWCSDKDISTWEGVTVQNGHVTGLTMINNNLCGSLPASIGSLTALKQLNLSGENTYLSGNLPKDIYSLTELEYLELNGSELTGSIPAEIGNLKKLKYFAVGQSNISGEIPAEIGQCESLQELHLSGTKISGVIPAEIGNLKKLKYFAVGQSNISGEIPAEIGQCESLQELRLSKTKISGVIPAEIGNLKNLQILMLYDTDISGEIPSRICEMTSLKSLNVKKTQLSGVIPTDIGRLTNLEWFDVSFCNLTGPLPESIGDWSKLKGLYINNNKLTGGIPASLSRLLNNKDLVSPKDNFGSIGIENNNFTGQIPDEITNHKNFSLIAHRFILSQNPGYGFDLSTFRFPARTQFYTGIDGTLINFGAEYAKNKYTLVFRYATDCVYAMEFLPIIKSLQQKYGSRGLKIICSIAMEYMPSDLSAEITKLGMQGFPHFIEMITNKVSNPYFVEYAGRMSTPFVGVVDHSGYFQFISMTPLMDFWRWDSNLSIVRPREHLEEFVAGLFGEVPDKPYESTDYSKDGKVTQLQTATKGNGINVVLMGDAFSDRLIADGTYEQTMRKAMNAFFAEEPYNSFRDHFNIYAVDVVSKNEQYGSGMQTALSGFFGQGSHVGGNDDECLKYAMQVPGITNSTLDKTLVIVMMNRKYYAGTCYMYYPSSGDYGCGASIAYFPLGIDDVMFSQLLQHEAGGHGFPKLGDEYSYQSYGGIPQDEIDHAKSMASYGWRKNIDFTSDITQIKWSKFISDPRYAAEALGAYEGALTYWTGAWRPTVNSIMRDNSGGFNAPSREAIYYRIHKLAYGDSWQYNYEDFVTYDARNRTSRASMLLRTPMVVRKDFVPLHPPVVKQPNW